MLTHIRTLTGHNGAVYKMLPAMQKDHFYSLGGDGFVVDWSITESDGLLIAKADEQIFTGATDLANQQLILGGFSGHVHWLSISEKKIVKKSAHHKGAVFGMVIHKEVMYSCGKDGYLVNWSLEDKIPLTSIKLSENGLRCVKVINENIYVTDTLGHLFILEPNSFDVIARHKLGDKTIFDVCQLNSFLYTGGRDAILKKWSIVDFKLIDETPAHWFTINAIMPVNDYIISVSRDKRIRMWDQNFQLKQSIDVQQGGHINSVNHILGVKDHIMTCSDDKTIQVFGLF